MLKGQYTPDIVLCPEKCHFDIVSKYLSDETEKEFAAILCDMHEKLIEKDACVMHILYIKENLK